MEAFWSVFLVVFLAEMGDKTQFLVMAFAAKYDWRRVFAGMFCGILVVHSLAVGVGHLVGDLVPQDIMALIAAVLFLGFGIWTLGSKDDDEEEAHDSRFGPFLTVALTFIVGEMGDKTQFAAMMMAAQYDSWVQVLCGAVAGMVLADSMGILVGTFLHRRLPDAFLRYLSGGIFLLFGLVGLWNAVFR